MAAKPAARFHQLALVEQLGAWSTRPQPPLSENIAAARLAAVRPQAAEAVKLRFYAGLTLEQIAPLFDLSPRTTRRLWVSTRAWLRRDIERSNDSAY